MGVKISSGQIVCAVTNFLLLRSSFDYSLFLFFISDLEVDYRLKGECLVFSSSGGGFYILLTF